MSLTYIRIDLARQLRDLSNLTFIVAMPVVMYLVFGATAEYGGERAGNGNVQFYVMSSMAVYGAAMAATSVTGTAKMEQILGWGRQIGLTPVTNRAVVAMKVVVALAITSFTILAIFTAGVLTGAEADSLNIWAATFGITLAGSALFGLFGYMVVQWFKSESALSVATGVLVLMSFLGNLFMPMSGIMLTIAKFTPLYGFGGLARWPILEGYIVNTTDGLPSRDSVWLLLANYGAWMLIFGALAIAGVRRSRGRL